MADRPLFTNEAALAGAKAIGLSIANPDADPDPIVAKLRLFDGDLIPDQGTTRDDLVAHETTLTGYPVGGYDITDFGSPDFAPLGGAISTSNLVHPQYESGPGVIIGGYWLEDATDPDPVVREVFVYDPPRTLATLGNGWPIVVQLGYGSNASA